MRAASNGVVENVTPNSRSLVSTGWTMLYTHFFDVGTTTGDGPDEDGIRGISHRFYNANAIKKGLRA